MKKSKPKTAAQKRRAKAKAKARKEDHERETWVQDRLDWIKIVDYHDHDFQHQAGNDDEDRCSNSDIDDDSDDIDSDEFTNESEVNSITEDCSGQKEKETNHTVSIISWNVLADSYCSRSSHKNLPSKFQSRVFNRNQRQHHVRQILRLFDSKMSPDLVALQEVDPPLEVAKCMKSLGYGVAETEASPDGRNGRVDSCGLYYREEKWTCLNHETIFLDDLAILRSSSSSDKPSDDISEKRRDRGRSSNTNSGSLKGLERSFVRKNVSLLATLEHKDTKRRIVVVVSHLFWNPAYDYVKLCQAHYIAKRASAFCKENNITYMVWAGDFNSQPQGIVHQYLTKGVVNAKVAAPWYTLSKNAVDINAENLHRLNLSDEKTELQEKSSPNVRYLLDYTLNKLCRWLRILGLDAALETEEEEIERTKNGNITIFQRCKNEGRSLVTTASKLLHRKDCPPGTYLLDTKSLRHLESAIVHLLKSHGVRVEPQKMLSRCVVCNGSIEPVFKEDLRQQIFQTYKAPEAVNIEGMDVYQCNSCSQGYWWSEKPTSSASRVKARASRLLELCMRGRVPIDGGLGYFDHIDVEKVIDRVTETDEIFLDWDQLDVVQWLQTEDLRNPLPQMSSAYALNGTQTESLPFTNVTHDFVGHLDYILFQSQNMEVTELLFVPKTFEDLNNLNIRNGHLLPSYDWPSDHLAIGCRLYFGPVQNNVDEGYVIKGPIPFPPGPPSNVPWCSFIDDTERHQLSRAVPPKLVPSSLQRAELCPLTGDRCLCYGMGCLPKVPSLFEMAELRRQHRLKLQQAESSS
eukprot:jgi/Psemu1/240109/estExt_Genewise1.C_1690012